MDITEVPPNPTFEVGARYLRKELHNQFRGQRQHGISTPASESFIFIFTDPDSEEYGYSDRFLDNGLFVYSGEGQVGDMTMDGGNERILNHRENSDSLYVFEKERIDVRVHELHVLVVGRRRGDVRRARRVAPALHLHVSNLL